MIFSFFLPPAITSSSPFGGLRPEGDSSALGVLVMLSSRGKGGRAPSRDVISLSPACVVAHAVPLAKGLPPCSSEPVDMKACDDLVYKEAFSL